MFAQRYPVFRVFILFCGGILLGNFLQLPLHYCAVISAISVILSLAFAFSKPVFFSVRWRWLFGFTTSLFFISVGVVITHLYSESHFKNHLSKIPDEQVYAQVQLLEDPQEKSRSMGVKARLKVLGSTPGNVRPASIKLMLYFEKDSASRQLRYGDRILINAYLNELDGPKNPFEFDYRDYLNLKAIYAQAYISGQSWKVISRDQGWWLLSRSKQLRRYLLEVVDSWNLDEVQTAVTKALLLGYRYDIDDSTLKAYASAGAMHVLAVSGLHVGIVYIMAGYLLFFLMKVKHGGALKGVLLILLLWIFALLTGMSASVVRAATMFTFVAIGSGFKRKTSIYNTILGSAMLLLVIRPSYLFEVGFQLSYAAVFGIVWMQPQLSQWYKPRTKVGQLIWGITTVSLAAQLATFPLSLYYFHQFPTLFLMSNLIVIPVVSLLMYLGVPLLALSGMGITLYPLVKVYSVLLTLMNTSVLWIERQANFLITEIHITRFELVLLYVLVIGGFWWLVNGGYRRLVVVMLALICFSFSQFLEKQKLSTSREIVAYAAPGKFAMGLYQPNDAYFLAASELLNDDDAMTFHIRHHWWALDARPDIINFDHLEKQHIKNCFFGSETTWVYLKQKGEKLLPDVDYIMVSEGYPDRGMLVRGAPVFILSNELKPYQEAKWKNWCESNKHAHYSLADQGALSIAVKPINPEDDGQSALATLKGLLYW